MDASCASPRSDPAPGGPVRRRALARALALVVLLAGGPPAGAQAQDEGTLALGLLVASTDPCSECIERGVRLALEQAAAAPGAARIALRVGRVESPWLSAADSARDLVLRQACVALIAPPDREVAHLAAQVATKLRVPVVALSADSTLTRARSPWIFRLVPDDRAQIRALLEALEPPPARAAALVPEGRAGSPVRADLRFVAGELGIVLEPVPVATAASAAEVLAPLRERRGEPLLIWLPETQSPPFLEAAGGLAWEGPVLMPGLAHGTPPSPPCATHHATAISLGDGRNPGDARFRESFLRAHGGEPDELAACAYDAATWLARAVQRAGPGADAIRAALTDGSEPVGASGPIRLDELGNRLGPWRVKSSGPQRSSRATPARDALLASHPFP